MSLAMSDSPALPHQAEVIERVREAPDITTLRLRLVDEGLHRAFAFRPGQFNMLYLFGVGAAAISIVSDPEDEHLFDHTIRAVGRVTRPLTALPVGARLGMRGPYGRGWPLEAAEGRDVLILTGGLGCAPVVSVIEYLRRRPDRFGRLIILQGVKHSDDLIWRTRYEAWAAEGAEVHLAADEATRDWTGTVGPVTRLLDRVRLDPARTVAMMCGPEPMMVAGARRLVERGLDPGSVHLSLERGMKCATGHCGQCQLGGRFLCRDGPVFAWPEVSRDLGRRGF
ncbi:MAG: FAD/NAD(P)-binding protein [Gammaproteobacteria bacterium]